MIALYCLVIVALSFTRLPTWLLVTLMVAPSAGVSIAFHDGRMILVTVLALLAALVVYAPIVLIASFGMAGGARAAFHRFRVVWFVIFVFAFVALTFNLASLPSLG